MQPPCRTSSAPGPQALVPGASPRPRHLRWPRPTATWLHAVRGHNRAAAAIAPGRQEGKGPGEPKKGTTTAAGQQRGRATPLRLYHRTVSCIGMPALRRRLPRRLPAADGQSVRSESRTYLRGGLFSPHMLVGNIHGLVKIAHYPRRALYVMCWTRKASTASYHTTTFFGLRIQWFSSGKTSSSDGTLWYCSASKRLRPSLMGQR